MLPLASTVMVACVLSDKEVAERHRMPSAPLSNVRLFMDAVVVPSQVTADPLPSLPVVEKRVALAMAHPLARPTACATATPAKARARAFVNSGNAIADRMPITEATIINSARVNPSGATGRLLCRPASRVRERRCAIRRQLNPVHLGIRECSFFAP